MDSRLRGNDGSWAEIYATICSLLPLPSGGRGLGRGWLYGLHEFDFASSHEATPILTFPPPDGGRNKVADTTKGRLKPKAWFQTTSSFFDFKQYYKIRAAVDGKSNDD